MKPFGRHVQECASGTDHAELGVDVLRETEIRNLDRKLGTLARQEYVLRLNISVNYCWFLGMSGGESRTYLFLNPNMVSSGSRDRDERKA